MTYSQHDHDVPIADQVVAGLRQPLVLRAIAKCIKAEFKKNNS